MLIFAGRPRCHPVLIACRSGASPSRDGADPELARPIAEETSNSGRDNSRSAPAMYPSPVRAPSAPASALPTLGFETFVREVVCGKQLPNLPMDVLRRTHQAVFRRERALIRSIQTAQRRLEQAERKLGRYAHPSVPVAMLAGAPAAVLDSEWTDLLASDRSCLRPCVPRRRPMARFRPRALAPSLSSCAQGFAVDFTQLLYRAYDHLHLVQLLLRIC